MALVIKVEDLIKSPSADAQQYDDEMVTNVIKASRTYGNPKAMHHELHVAWGMPPQVDADLSTVSREAIYVTLNCHPKTYGFGEWSAGNEPAENVIEIKPQDSNGDIEYRVKGLKGQVETGKIKAADLQSLNVNNLPVDKILQKEEIKQKILSETEKKGHTHLGAISEELLKTTIKNFIEETQSGFLGDRQTFIFTVIAGGHICNVTANSDGEILIVDTLSGEAQHIKWITEALKEALQSDKAVEQIRPADASDKLHQKDGVSCGVFATFVAAAINPSQPLAGQKEKIKETLTKKVAAEAEATKHNAPKNPLLLRAAQQTLVDAYKAVKSGKATIDFMAPPSKQQIPTVSYKEGTLEEERNKKIKEVDEKFAQSVAGYPDSYETVQNARKQYLCSDTCLRRDYEVKKHNSFVPQMAAMRETLMLLADIVNPTEDKKEYHNFNQALSEKEELKRLVSAVRTKLTKLNKEDLRSLIIALQDFEVSGDTSKFSALLNNIKDLIKDDEFQKNLIAADVIRRSLIGQETQPDSDNNITWRAKKLKPLALPDTQQLTKLEGADPITSGILTTKVNEALRGKNIENFNIICPSPDPNKGKTRIDFTFDNKQHHIQVTPKALKATGDSCDEASFKVMLAYIAASYESSPGKLPIVQIQAAREEDAKAFIQLALDKGLIPVLKDKDVVLSLSDQQKDQVRGVIGAFRDACATEATSAKAEIDNFLGRLSQKQSLIVVPPVPPPCSELPDAAVKSNAKPDEIIKRAAVPKI